MFLLLKRIRDKGEDLLILVQQEHGSQISQPLVCEPRGGQEFETFYLTEMCPLSQREEIEEFCNIVPPGFA